MVRKKEKFSTKVRRGTDQGRTGHGCDASNVSVARSCAKRHTLAASDQPSQAEYHTIVGPENTPFGGAPLLSETVGSSFSIVW